MPLRDLFFKPGILTEAPDREVGKFGFWKDCNFVRFFNGFPEQIGGYVKDNASSSVIGKARGAFDWKTLRNETFIAVGTHKKLYIWQGGTFYDITPIRDSGTLNNPFTTTDGSAIVSVSDTSHGLAAGDYVRFSGAAAVGGITISGEYEVTSITDANTYTITHTAAATSSAGPGGGAAVAYEYDISAGSEITSIGLGWGIGTWGGGTWGTARTSGGIATDPARTWSLDTWGEDLLASPRGGALYVWDSSGGVSSNRATLISQAPQTMQAMIVSQEDRHVVALGAYDGAANDPLLVRWCSQEDYTSWTATTTNTAGDKRLGLGDTILAAIPARGEIVIHTNSHCYSMVFSGPPDTFSFRPLGDNGGLAGAKAIKNYNGILFWMGLNGFYTYDGAIKTIPCAVHSHVFDDANTEQFDLVTAGVITRYNEVWWFYPAGTSDEVDRYVVYNIAENLWYFGELERTSFVGDSDVIAQPYGMGTDGYLYYHESGVTTDTAGALGSFIESGDVELDEGGNAIMHVSRYIPDFRTIDSSAQVTLIGKKYPSSSETSTSGPHTITAATTKVNTRLRARQVYVRIDGVGGSTWRVGTIRVDQQPHGGR